MCHSAGKDHEKCVSLNFPQNDESEDIIITAYSDAFCAHAAATQSTCMALLCRTYVEINCSLVIAVH